jgi:hypothetical protein
MGLNMRKKRGRKWDANWDRLRLETKVDKLRIRIKKISEDFEDEVSSAYSKADCALYVANLNR